MIDVTWVKIKSWHAVRLMSDRDGRTSTLCGRLLGDPTEQDVVEYSMTLPAEKSCEVCLRIVARRVDVT
jgi:hypothetical protein